MQAPLSNNNENLSSKPKTNLEVVQGALDTLNRTLKSERLMSDEQIAAWDSLIKDFMQSEGANDKVHSYHTTLLRVWRVLFRKIGTDDTMRKSLVQTMLTGIDNIKNSSSEEEKLDGYRNIFDQFIEILPETFQAKIAKTTKKQVADNLSNTDEQAA